MVKLDPSPNPQWKIGSKIHTFFDLEMKSIDFSTLTVAEKYSYMNGAIVPRPIAFVSSINNKGQVNLSPFSFFNGISSNPPIIMFSVARKSDGSKKDTLINILETKEFVINSSHEWMAEALHQTSAEYDNDINEFTEIGFTEVLSTKVKAPRVKESAVQFECKLRKTIDFGIENAGSVTVIFGEILIMHASKSICKGGMILIDEYKPISRLGGPFYAKTNETFKLPRAKK